MISYAFHPEADAEFAAIVAFYEARSIGLGCRFVEALEATVLRLRQYPESGSLISSGQRRMLVRRFPYAVIYQFSGDALYILAIAHTRRHPTYWQHRQ